MFRFTVGIVAIACIFATAFAAPYGPASGHAPSGHGHSAPAVQVLNLPHNAEAQAAALTDAAGAKASASKINAVNWDALNQYGYQIGIPLLAKPYGSLSSLYAASLPPRSFVGKIDPAFLRDSYGNIKFVGETSIGVAAI